jgi:hypothetical protein
MSWVRLTTAVDHRQCQRQEAWWRSGRRGELDMLRQLSSSPLQEIKVAGKLRTGRSGLAGGKWVAPATGRPCAADTSIRTQHCMTKSLVWTLTGASPRCSNRQRPAS